MATNEASTPKARASSANTDSPTTRIAEGSRQLGAQIRHHRQEQARSLRELAGAAGISPGYLSDLENGNRLPSLERLDMIAQVLEVTVSDLLRPTWPYGEGKLRRRSASG